MLAFVHNGQNLDSVGRWSVKHPIRRHYHLANCWIAGLDRHLAELGMTPQKLQSVVNTRHHTLRIDR